MKIFYKLQMGKKETAQTDNANENLFFPVIPAKFARHFKCPPRYIPIASFSFCVLCKCVLLLVFALSSPLKKHQG